MHKILKLMMLFVFFNLQHHSIASTPEDIAIIEAFGNIVKWYELTHPNYPNIRVVVIGQRVLQNLRTAEEANQIKNFFTGFESFDFIGFTGVPPKNYPFFARYPQKLLRFFLRQVLSKIFAIEPGLINIQEQLKTDDRYRDKIFLLEANHRPTFGELYTTLSVGSTILLVLTDAIINSFGFHDISFNHITAPYGIHLTNLISLDNIGQIVANLSSLGPERLNHLGHYFQTILVILREYGHAQTLYEISQLMREFEEAKNRLPWLKTVTNLTDPFMEKQYSILADFPCAWVLMPLVGLLRPRNETIASTLLGTIKALPSQEDNKIIKLAIIIEALGHRSLLRCLKRLGFKIQVF